MGKYLSADYRSYMASDEWRAKKLAFYSSPATPKRCQGCDSKRSLDLHHLTYARFKRERFTDLIPVCRRCHDAIHEEFSSRGGGLVARTASILSVLRVANGLPPIAVTVPALAPRKKPVRKGKPKRNPGIGTPPGRSPETKAEKHARRARMIAEARERSKLPERDPVNRAMRKLRRTATDKRRLNGLG